ncbi:MAG: tRNA adenosine(34) deaminase TadA [Eubacterium sp.]|nr:tRNA adenosine(34) deaminase TadA [Eubacterium sp.]
METNDIFMKEAIRLARKAYKKDETPIGCVIVRDGRIIARGYNLRNTKKNTLCHAEITAIRKACKKVGDWRLEDCVMYVTLEPCPMCAGAIVQARIPKVVIGCRSPKGGCAGSVIDLFNVDGLNHKVALEESELREECQNMLREFFKELRIKKRNSKDDK